MRLVHKATGAEVQIGDKVRSFRGEDATVTGIERPGNPASTGRLYVQWDGTDGCLGGIAGYFPSVFDCEWVDREDRKEVPGVTV